MTLVVAELGRLWHRRASWVLLGTGVALVLLVALPITAGAAGIAWQGYGTAVIGIAGLIGCALSGLLGGTFWGADFRHGTIATLLTFVPDRLRVWAARTVAVALGGLCLAAAVLGWAWLLVGVLSGGAAFLGEEGAQSLDLTGRILALCVMAALLGAFLATIFKSTAAAAFVPLAYLLLRGVFALARQTVGGGVLQFVLPDAYLAAFITGEAQIYLGGRYGEPDIVDVGFAQGAAYLLGVLAAVGAISAALFHRRSVTE